MKHQVVITTDGSCAPNPGRGGWAFKVSGINGSYYGRGNVDNTTNNRMELQAVLEALITLKTRLTVKIRTDSSVVISACSKNGWAYEAGRKKKPPANYDLVRRIMDEMLKHEVYFEWVRGHAGDPDNELVDGMATHREAC